MNLIELRGQRSEGTSTIFIVESLYEGRPHKTKRTENNIFYRTFFLSWMLSTVAVNETLQLSHICFTHQHQCVCALSLLYEHMLYIFAVTSSSFLQTVVAPSVVLATSWAIVAFAVTLASWLYFTSSVWKLIFELTDKDYVIVYFFFYFLFWQGNPRQH